MRIVDVPFVIAACTKRLIHTNGIGKLRPETVA